MAKNKTDELDSTNVQESADLGRIQANKLLVAIAIEAAKLAERSITLETSLAKLIDIQWKTDSPELRAEIVAACDAGESAMEELLIKLLEGVQVVGSVEESIIRETQNKFTATQLIRMEDLKTKLTAAWLRVPKGTDSTELRAEIVAAYDAGEYAMEELLIKLLEGAQVVGSVEKSIIRETQNQINDRRDKLELEKMIRMNKLRDKLVATWVRAPEKKDWSEVRDEIYAACDDGERAMEELLIKLLEMAETVGNGEESTIRIAPNLTNVDRDKLELEKMIRMNKLRDKLIVTWLSTPEKKDWSEVRDEIYTACDDGINAMVELLIELRRDKWGSEEMFREDKLQDQLMDVYEVMSDGVPDMLSEVLSNITQNSKKQNKTTTDPLR